MKTWKISIRHSNKPCMNTAVLLYMVGRCAWWVGAWVAGVLCVPLLYCCGTAVRGGCGWVVGAFDFRPPLVLQRTKSKTHCCVSACFILSFSCGYKYMGRCFLGFCCNSHSVSYRVCIEVKTPGTPGDGVWYLVYDV